MSLVVARKKRTALYLSIAGLLAMAAAISAVSARDPDGVSLRVGMIMLVVGAALWLPWQALLPAALLIWIGPNYARDLIEDKMLFSANMMLELPGILGLAAFSALTRLSLQRLEEEDRLVGATIDEFSGLDPDTGVYEESLMRPAIEAELARSRRFSRQFALVLVGIEEMRQKFDYRDQEAWDASFNATASLLRSTRTHIDRAYRFGESSFALILPESGEREVSGLIRRLRRVSRVAKPAEGEPGGPLPTHFGATFFPTCATTTEDLLRRAEVALRVAEKSSSRVQIDGAEAPDMAPPETMRRPDLEVPEIAASAIDETDEVEATPVSTPVVVPMLQPRMQPAIAQVVEPATVLEPVPVAPIPLPIPLYAPPAPSISVPAAILEHQRAEQEPQEVPVLALVQERRPFAVVSPLPAPEVMPAVQVVAQPVMAAEPSEPEPAPEREPQPVMAGAASSSAPDDSMTDLMKHLDETLAMIRSLRTGAPTV